MSNSISAALRGRPALNISNHLDQWHVANTIPRAGPRLIHTRRNDKIQLTPQMIEEQKGDRFDEFVTVYPVGVNLANHQDFNGGTARRADQVPNSAPYKITDLYRPPMPNLDVDVSVDRVPRHKMSFQLVKQIRDFKNGRSNEYCKMDKCVKKYEEIVRPKFRPTATFELEAPMPLGSVSIDGKLAKKLITRPCAAPAANIVEGEAACFKASQNRDYKSVFIKRNAIAPQTVTVPSTSTNTNTMFRDYKYQPNLRRNYPISFVNITGTDTSYAPDQLPDRTLQKLKYKLNPAKASCLSERPLFGASSGGF